ncbi:hypothetical protein GEV33_014309 [Tenebrio molitor]|uniref:Uncharacterized protein n=1 Tax=Tenebrio molitor TaxID=7067 RepID=A0A8J6H5Z0_TENMO|nr:hypothetical protein GEV33_014309 [Tenebrio molitor]
MFTTTALFIMFTTTALDIIFTANIAIGTVDRNTSKSNRQPEKGRSRRRNPQDNVQGRSSSTTSGSTTSSGTFSDNYKNWTNFENSFKSVIHENKGLNNRQRFQYLKSCLREEALRAIQSLPIEDENYEKAWEILENRKIGLQHKKKDWQTSLDTKVPTYGQFINSLEKRCTVLESLNSISTKSPNQAQSSNSSFQKSTQPSKNPGSMSNCITKNMFAKLGLKSLTENFEIRGLNGTVSSATQSVLINLKSSYNDYTLNKIKCIVVDKITEHLPLTSLNSSTLEIPTNVQLADPKFYESGEVDLLLGGGLFWSLLCIGQITLPTGLVLQKTHFGFIAGGPYNNRNNQNRPAVNSTACNLAITSVCNSTLEDKVCKFWEIENTEPVRTYALTTLTYGTKPASFIATRCLKELADINASKFPKGCEIIKNDFYMDDLLTGADSITELVRLREDVTHILKQGHFELRKFQSNDIRALPTNENSDPNLVQIREALNLNCGLSTIRLRLHELGVHARTPAKKIQLTPAQAEARLQFCMDNLNRDRDWILLFVSSGDVTAPGIIPRMFVPIEVADGPGEITQITPPRFNSHRYWEILEEVMLPTVHNIYPEEERPRFAFVQDNCSIHRANIIMDWFADHPEIDLIRWPSKSPDLNPIENLWGQMILNWGDPFHGARRRAVEELDANVRRVWTMLRGRDYCRNMVAGMRESFFNICGKSVIDIGIVNVVFFAFHVYECNNVELKVFYKT